jgi:hypothetical protein
VGVLLDAVEESLHDVALRVLRGSQGPCAHALVAAHDARDRHHALHVGREEIVSRGLAAALRGEVDHRLVAHVGGHAPELAQPRGVGNGLDVEDEDRRHDEGNTPVER